jgi:hypothetical protein
MAYFFSLLKGYFRTELTPHPPKELLESIPNLKVPMPEVSSSECNCFRRKLYVIET